MARRSGAVRGRFIGLASFLAYFGFRCGLHAWAAWPHPAVFDLAAAAAGAAAFPAWWVLKSKGLIVEASHPVSHGKDIKLSGVAPLRPLSPSAFRCPAFLFNLLQVPLVFLAYVVVILGGAWLFYGARDELITGAFHWGGLLAAPGLLLDAAYLLGRVEVVHGAPAPQREGEAPPALLALPGEGGGEMRALEPPKPVDRTRWAADGVAFWGGAVSLAVAGVLMFVSQDEFDSVLGVKLGGRWFHGTYWNNWWFVFYAFLYSGLASLGLGALLYIARLNRRAD